MLATNDRAILLYVFDLLLQIAFKSKEWLQNALFPTAPFVLPLTVINETIPIQINTLWRSVNDVRSLGWGSVEGARWVLGGIEVPPLLRNLLLPLLLQYVKMAYYLVNDFRQLTIDRLVSLIPIHHK